MWLSGTLLYYYEHSKCPHLPMDEKHARKVTLVKSSEIRKAVDDFLLTAYPYEKDPDERIRMYVRRVDGVTIPFYLFDEKFHLDRGTCSSHF